MNGPLKLAWLYICHNKLKSAILVACIFLTALLPIAIQILLIQFDQKIVSRASSTPAVIGAKGSRLDLTLNAIYFKSDSASTIPYSEVAKIQESELAAAIPIHSLYTARKFPVVGTSVDYFDFRNLTLSQGARFAFLGDCVLGNRISEKLELSTGEQLLTDRENVLDLGGQTPINLNITGVLNETNTPDDWAIFVDLKTAWVIQGLGHGHQDLNEESPDSPILLGRDDQKITASAGVASYIEITPDNVDSFHFHGDFADFPITSIIAIANDAKNETILEGRYTGAPTLQFAKPTTVVRDLMSLVFQVKRFFDANAILIAISTLLLLILVLLLSLRLRQREMETMFKIGCSRGTIRMLQLMELAIIFGVALVLLVMAVSICWHFSGDLVENLLIAQEGPSGRS